MHVTQAWPIRDQFPSDDSDGLRDEHEAQFWLQSQRAPISDLGCLPSPFMNKRRRDCCSHLAIMKAELPRGKPEKAMDTVKAE